MLKPREGSQLDRRMKDDRDRVREQLDPADREAGVFDTALARSLIEADRVRKFYSGKQKEITAQLRNRVNECHEQAVRIELLSRDLESKIFDNEQARKKEYDIGLVQTNKNLSPSETRPGIQKSLLDLLVSIFGEKVGRLLGLFLGIENRFLRLIK